MASFNLSNAVELGEPKPNVGFNLSNAVELEQNPITIYSNKDKKSYEVTDPSILGNLKRIASGGYNRGLAGLELNDLRASQIFGDDSPETENRVKELKSELSKDVETIGWAEDAFRAWAEATPQLMGVIGQATRRAVEGAGVGAVTSFVKGVRDPRAVAVSALGAGAVGGKFGVAEFSFYQNAGEAFNEFVDYTDVNGQKIDRDAARLASVLVGLPNAALDVISIGTASKVFAGKNLIFDKLQASGVKSIVVPKGKDALLQFARDLTTSFATEVSTEGAQAGIKGIGGNLLKYLSTQEFEPTPAENIWAEVVANMSEAAKVQAGLGLVGGGVRVGGAVIKSSVSTERGGGIKDAGLAAKAIVEDAEQNPPDVRNRVQSLIDSGQTFSMRELQSIVKGEDIAELRAAQKAEIEKIISKDQDPSAIAAELLKSRNIDDEIKSSVRALGRKFTIEQLKKATFIQDFVSRPKQYIDTPEFKTRFEGSKVVDEQGAPLRVYHGTGKDFATFQVKSGAQGQSGKEAFFFSKDPAEASIYARESTHDPVNPVSGFQSGENIRPVYISAKNPLTVPENQTVNAEMLRSAKARGYDAVIDERGNVAVFSPDQIIPAFGDNIKNTSLRSLDSPKTDAAKRKRELYNKHIEAEKSSGRFGDGIFREGLATAAGGLSKALTPISTRLRNINPKFEARLRKFEFDRNKTINKDSAIAKPFLEKFSKLSEEDRIVLDYAMKNADEDVINEIAKSNGMEKEIADLRAMFDDMYKRAKRVNLEIEYKKGFFPRHVTEPKKLLAYFSKTEAWSDIDAAIKTKELEQGSPLTTEEKAQLINTLLRGYKTSNITLAKPGALKERSIDTVTPEINKFYATTDQAILKYISTVNDAIETRRFLGKDAETIEDSIGAFALAEMEKGTLNPNQAQELSEILKARFNQGKMNPLLKAYKNLSYIDTMGSPTSAITQLGGLSYSLSNNGVYRTLRNISGATTDSARVSLEDLGIDRIAEEFTDGGTTGNAVRKVFKLVGLQNLDRIDKLTYINSSLERFEALAKNPTKEFRASLENIFEEETDSVISDLKNGNISENVKLLLFNDILDIQPIAKSEMPELYLSHPNGRIFYMLKSFTLKQYDIYRRQVFNELASGNTLKGLKNLTRLVGFFVVMNAGASFLKDLLLGRDTPPEDAVVNTIAQVFGFSKYQVYSVRREGLGTAAFKTIAPPFKFIDAASKDIAKSVKQGQTDWNNLKSVESIPIGGKMYYWWFGGGVDRETKFSYE